MGLDVSSKIVVGISLAKIFTKIAEQDNSYDEHDSRGNKTGRRVEEYGLYATLPNGNVVCIANGKKHYGQIRWSYDFYHTLGFDGSEYVGDTKTDIGLHYADYESKNLSDTIAGFQIASTGSHRNNELIKEVDSNKLNDEMFECTKQLKDLFGYTGEVKVYLMTNCSY